MLLRGPGDDEMAFWPFGRKNKNKKKDTQSMDSSTRNQHPDTTRRDPGSELSDVSPPVSGRRLSRQDSRRRQGSTRKLTKAQRSRIAELEKTEPLNQDPESSIPSSTQNEDEKAELKRVPQLNLTRRKPSIPNRGHGDVPAYYFQNPASLSSLQPENFNVTSRFPTLIAKRSVTESSLTRRKSSKRKADDLAREQEIKAMSSPIPVPKRPQSHSSGLLARDSKRIPGGLNRNLERPLSEVSLPLPESVHSTMSVISDSHGFKVSAFDALSPRPTIRYFENPRNNIGSGNFVPSRTSARIEKQPVIPEEVSKPKKRVDELADDLDSSSLRELMERDRRRSDRQRRSEQERLHRRLQRRAEKQQLSAEKSGGELAAGPSSENADPRTVSEGEVGVGIEKDAASVRKKPSLELKRGPGKTTPESWPHGRSRERLALGSPFNDPIPERSPSHVDSPTSGEELDEPVLETAKAVRLSQASMSPPISPANQLHGPPSLSHLSELASRSTSDIRDRIEMDRRDSDNSSRVSSHWTSIFRRSGTRAKRDSSDRGRAAPSEFSNTSRESFARQMDSSRQLPPSAFTRIPPARSGTPVRTQSRFREDLPELPTPPDSRLQSPEVATTNQLPRLLSVAAAQVMPGIPSSPDQPLSDIHPAFREEVALSRHQSIKSQSADIPSNALLSQSLASVDSEGSWLTGRPVKRSSQTLVNPLRESGSSLQQRLLELGASEEEIRRAENDKEYSERLSPDPDEIAPREVARRRQYLAGGAGIGSDSEDDNTLHSQPVVISHDEGKLHSAVGKQPTIVRQGARAKSREGLLNDFQAAEYSAEEDSPTGDSPIGQPFEPALARENSFIHRATSIDLGKGHVRHISAGSAKLLNLPPRNSGEMKRVSTASGERSPLSPPPIPSNDGISHGGGQMRDHIDTSASDVD